MFSKFFSKSDDILPHACEFEHADVPKHCLEKVLQDAEMEGRGEELAAGVPPLAPASQQALAQPVQQEPVILPLHTHKAFL